MGQSHPREYYERLIETVHECLEEGFPLTISGNAHTGHATAIGEAARRLGAQVSNFRGKLVTAEKHYGLTPDPSRYRPRQAQPTFTLAPLPHDGDLSAEELIEAGKRRHAQRKLHHEAAKLRRVDVNIDGPIGIAFIGDPHIDDPGCAWGDLEKDVRICRDTPGVLAVDVGDDTNNWVGRLQRLYANQEVTSKQALRLIEWLMGTMPWLLRIKGNHDSWNTDKGDVADYIHRLFGSVGALEESGARMELHLPAGCSFRLHVRHDFPGNSQFNPAHALVRETLFGFSDHVMACGHRHTAGYIPIWRPEPHRLCHGIRVASYKDFDHYAKEKHFQDGQWARSMGVTVDPAYADDPVRFIKSWYCLEDMAEYLTWRRSKWEMGKSAAA